MTEKALFRVDDFLASLKGAVRRSIISLWGGEHTHTQQAENDRMMIDKEANEPSKASNSKSPCKKSAAPVISWNLHHFCKNCSHISVNFNQEQKEIFQGGESGKLSCFLYARTRVVKLILFSFGYPEFFSGLDFIPAYRWTWHNHTTANWFCATNPSVF